MARAVKPISEAMARRVAWMWVERRGIAVALDGRGYSDPTTIGLISRGLLAPTGERGHWPNGAEYEVHRLTPAALVALRDFLTKEISNGKD